MKVGDLVRYKPEMRGLEKLMGLVLEFNSDWAVIRWNVKRTLVDSTVTHITEELSEFIEVIGGG